MNSIWFYVLLTVTGLSGVAVAGVLVLHRRLRLRLQACEAELRALRMDFAALSTANTGVGKELGQLEQHVRRIAERQDQFELRDGGNRSYAQAIRMVQNGADVKDLMTTCALTRGEAELLVMLHGMKRAG